MKIDFKEVLIFFNNGQVDKAEKLSLKILKKEPNNLEILHLLGLIFYKKKNYLKSIQIFNKIIKLNQNDAQVFYNRGNVLFELKNFDKALESYNKAIIIKPDYKKAHNNRGNIFKELNRFNEALKSYQIALKIEPNNPDLYNNCGTIFLELKKFDKAIENYKHAIKINTNYFEAYFNLGNTFNKIGKVDEAIKSYKEALKINPKYANAYNNLGIVFKGQKKIEEAIICFRKTIEINPNFDFLFGTLIQSKCIICDWEFYFQDLDKLKNKILDNNRSAPPFSILSFFDSPKIQKKTSITWVEQKFSKKNILKPIKKRQRNKKIRIGYYSADFREHAMSYLLVNLFELHDKSQFELIAFSFGPKANGEIFTRILKAFDQFIDVNFKTDKEIAQLSRNLKIDIAVDLMGFTEKNRFNIFVERCAPIQINYLGYPGTLGSNCIDYIIADKVLIPEQNQKYYSEKIVYLPNSYQVNDSNINFSKKILKRKDFGLSENDFIFCCFNQNYKITPTIFDAWMNILKRVKNSALWLIEDNHISPKNLKKKAKQRNVDDRRIIFSKRLPHAEHLLRHKLADLFIDTFPYTAHTTASDALRSGLPLITIKGQSFASRVAASLLTTIDLPELITTTEKDYIELAVKIAKDLKILNQLLEKLKKNLVEKPLFNTTLFTKNIELAYTTMLEKYYLNEPINNIYIK